MRGIGSRKKEGVLRNQKGPKEASKTKYKKGYTGAKPKSLILD